MMTKCNARNGSILIWVEPTFNCTAPDHIWPKLRQKRIQIGLFSFIRLETFLSEFRNQFCFRCFSRVLCVRSVWCQQFSLCQRYFVLQQFSRCQATHAKCHFLYTIRILGKIILPQKVRNFWQYLICDKAAKAKKTINRLKIIQIQWKYNIISLKIP